jgi:microcin C transport system permease protein
MQITPSATFARRGWQRFRKNKLGFYSLVILCTLLCFSLMAEVISNDKPLVVRYEGHWYFPVLQNIPETTFQGDFQTNTDYLDPFIRTQFEKPGNFLVFPLNRYHHSTINYFATMPNPASPSAENWLGTDDRGRDVFARLLYGFRVSFLFGLVLTIIGTVIGVLAGLIQGYFAGKVDLFGQRFIEIWSSMPELYLLIIFAALFEPSIFILVGILSLFGWLGLSGLMRAEALRNRQMDYVRSARALGLSHWQIMLRHVLPNSLTPIVTFLPFAMSGAIVSLTALDFLGLGVPQGTPSLGEMLSQGKSNIDAWWITLATTLVIILTLLLLTFMGDALRDALDPRKADQIPNAQPPKVAP